MRVLVCAGGTYGHTMPALAVVDRLQCRCDDLEILLLGTRRGLGHGDLPGLCVQRIGSAPLAGIHPLKVPLNLARNASAYLSALALVRDFDPQIALSTGGYPSVAGALAARTLGRPLLLLALDRRPGLAVGLQARIANLVCCVDAESRRRLSVDRAIISGLPLRSQFDHPDRDAGRRRIGIGPDQKLLLVIGGSQGSSAINQAVSRQLPHLLEHSQLVHVTGSRQIDDARSDRARLAEGLRSRYHPFEFVDCGFADLLAASDLVVSRAGAGAVAEIAATARPAIFVPGRFAGGHQRDNTEPLVRAGAATVMDEDHLDRLAERAGKLITDCRQLGRMSGAGRGVGRPDAARFVAEQVLKLGIPRQ
jgi:UDP-N-acetylglucosamine--N-acetylmuramyl-(pentapeptide) pyrophosphoryl-undecaprenol N-acetylglucosamine transferase